MKLNVPHVAKLANLTLTDEEITKFEKQLSDVLSYVDRLQEVHTDGVEETSQSTGLENVTRSDKTEKSLSQNEALSNAPKVHNHMFEVKGLLENE